MQQEIYRLYHQEEDDWWWSAGRRALVRSLWRRFGTDDARPRALEVGCGTGGLLHEMRSWAEAYGLDVSPDAMRYSRERGLKRICQGGLNALPYGDDSFDGVIAVDVLEHVKDDIGALREMHRVCRPDGVLVATVPAFQFLWSRRDEQLGHVRRYTFAQFKDRVAAAGWSVRKATYLNLPLFLPLLIMVAIGRITRRSHSLNVDYALVPGPMNRVTTRFVQAEARLLAHVSLPLGTSIAIVASKTRQARPVPPILNERQ